MKTLPLLLLLWFAGAGPAQAGPDDWLGIAAGSLGYDRCEDMLGLIARDGIAGRPVGKNLEGARQLPDKQLLGGFVLSKVDAQSRHQTFTLGENQEFLCEGRLVTSYVEKGDCDAFIRTYLDEARLLGEMDDGRTRVYANDPYQLYLSEVDGLGACMVTGIRRLGSTDPRSNCAWSDVGNAAAELCMLFRGNGAPVLSLKLDNQPVLVLREDLTDEFRLTHPPRGQGGDGKPVVISGHCRAEREGGLLSARICTLSWGGRELFHEVRLGAPDGEKSG